MPKELHAIQNIPIELAFQSGKKYNDPFNDIEVNVAFTDPSGKDVLVPAFWAGNGEWRVRFAPRVPGAHRYRTICSDKTSDLHNHLGVLNATPYEGDNPLLRHGPLRVAQDRRHFEHVDGTPFFWLGDTWWMGLCKRLSWPDDFRLLAADRKAKGFTVVQIVAGLYPDMPWLDERGANEAGFPWTDDFSTINPAYFDSADLRIQWLVRCGIVPFIVGCWGYFLPWMGVEKMKKHWRHIIARWGAYPVVWCLAGEGTMPYYLSTTKQRDEQFQKKGWTEVGRYVQTIDPCGHPVTIHPSNAARDTVEDDSVLDFDMLQTGHSGHESIANTEQTMRRELARTPRMPVVNGEVCYEGILEGSREEIQRFMFWSCMLSGAAGHTYGANGIWQFNGMDRPYGPSPWGAAWGNRPWQEAYRLPGSQQVALGKALLERYPWWRFEPHQEWIEPAAAEGHWTAPYAAGIPGHVRVIYLPQPIFPWGAGTVVKGIEPNSSYSAYLFDPKTSQEHHLGPVTPDANGSWRVPLPPVAQDWVLVLGPNRQPPQPAPVMFA